MARQQQEPGKDPEGGQLLSLKRTTTRGGRVIGHRTFFRNAATPGYILTFYRLRAFYAALIENESFVVNTSATQAIPYWSLLREFRWTYFSLSYLADFFSMLDDDLYDFCISRNAERLVRSFVGSFFLRALLRGDLDCRLRKRTASHFYPIAEHVR